MERIKKLLGLLLIMSCIFVSAFADEVQEQRIIPAAKDINLAPIETQIVETNAVNFSQPVDNTQDVSSNKVNDGEISNDIQSIDMDVPIEVQAVPVKDSIAEPQVVSEQVEGFVQESVQESVQTSSGRGEYKPSVQLAAPERQVVNSLTIPVDIESDACVKIFQLKADDLFELTLAALEANNFAIDEIQSRGGYITFNAANRDFLVVVSEIDNKNSILKITPANGVYHFAPGIIYKVFEYITLKIK